MTLTDKRDLFVQAVPLLRLIARRWWRYARADSPDDLAHDIAARVLARLGRYDPARWPFAVWVQLNESVTDWGKVAWLLPGGTPVVPARNSPAMIERIGIPTGEVSPESEPSVAGGEPKS